jgi:hypothetical protein
MVNRLTDPYLANNIEEDYLRARRRAKVRALGRALRHQESRLYSLHEVDGRLTMTAERYVGIMQVPVRRIVGSVARYHDFDRDFNPLRDNIRTRWERVAEAHLLGITLPPVELLKVGDSYLVRDGNHRVSVARHYGLDSIDADVIEYVTPCALDKSAHTGPAHPGALLARAHEYISSIVRQITPLQKEQSCACCE